MPDTPGFYPAIVPFLELNTTQAFPENVAFFQEVVYAWKSKFGFLKTEAARFSPCTRRVISEEVPTRIIYLPVSSGSNC
jgi:hypothetical protein